MKSLRLLGLAMLVAIATAAVAPAYGQQPSASPTPAPRWCPQVPETPAPPHWKPEDWAHIFRSCSSFRTSTSRNTLVSCRRMCEAAQDAWSTSKNPPHQPLYQSTTELQGPIQLPGGGTEYIVPLLPIPSPSASPAAGDPQGSADPGGPFAGGYFPGADLSALNNNPPHDQYPPDVAADVSPTQNVEFVKDLGLYVWAKPTLPIPSPAPTPPAPLSMTDFWCLGSQISGQQPSKCVTGAPPPGYALTDPQIGYDASLGRWIATTLDYLKPGNQRTAPDYVYIAVSYSGTAFESFFLWTKWSVPVCTSNSSTPSGDQPLLGWSGSFVGVDVLCFDSLLTTRGSDSLIVVPNSSLAPSPASSLPNPIAPPCIGMTPVRDEDASQLSSLYLVGSMVPGTMVPGSGYISQPTTCGLSGYSSYISPYVVEYTATSNGVLAQVFGQGGNACLGNSACTPLSDMGPLGNPGTYSANSTGAGQQLDCNTPDCLIDANDARIKAAQIRMTNNNGSQDPILTLGFNTGYQANDNLTGSQALWALQDMNTSGWYAFSLAGNNYWMSYPTVAIDSDFDLYLGSTWFNAGIYPSTVWDLFSGTGFTYEGQNGIEQSTREYTGNGDPNATLQRWGDYNTMVYDPNAIGPGGEPVFWEVEEITCSSLSNATCQGGMDESTSWVALVGPEPQFVGVSEAESEPSATPTSTASYTIETQVNPPSGAQNGDVLIAILQAGTPTTGSTPTLPAGWTLLNLINQGSTTMTTTATCGFFEQSQIAVHTYSTSDTVPYTFTFYTTPASCSICPALCPLPFPQDCLTGESEVYLNDYSFAGTDFTKYAAYGFPNNDSGGVSLVVET